MAKIHGGERYKWKKEKHSTKTATPTYIMYEYSMIYIPIPRDLSVPSHIDIERKLCVRLENVSLQLPHWKGKRRVKREMELKRLRKRYPSLFTSLSTQLPFFLNKIKFERCKIFPEKIIIFSLLLWLFGIEVPANWSKQKNFFWFDPPLSNQMMHPGTLWWETKNFFRERENIGLCY